MLEIHNFKSKPKEIVVNDMIHDTMHGFIPLKFKKKLLLAKITEEDTFPIDLPFLLTGLEDQTNTLATFLRYYPSLKISLFYKEGKGKIPERQVDYYKSFAHKFIHELKKNALICENRISLQDLSKTKIARSKPGESEKAILIYAIITDTGTFLFSDEKK